jgi:hypothetical protein
MRRIFPIRIRHCPATRTRRHVISDAIPWHQELDIQHQNTHGKLTSKMHTTTICIGGNGLSHGDPEGSSDPLAGVRA